MALPTHMTPSSYQCTFLVCGSCDSKTTLNPSKWYKNPWVYSTSALKPLPVSCTGGIYKISGEILPLDPAARSIRFINVPVSSNVQCSDGS
ncbi:galactosyltransferase superfamily protein [Metarhizium robertsii]|uniref:Galactosyltransferase superfamily protein n=1 Tax=Metarhizium robertsii TaxID=568076 RepID=A0A0A1UZ16_9HYPO|nr:galactosyltransferase superfamily protein [Metarhizium robertsii]